MNDSAIAFLELPEARKMVAAWPIVGRNATAEEMTPTSKLLVAWSRVAGVGTQAAASLMPVLFENEIVLPLGGVAPVAALFIRRAAFAAIGVKIPAKGEEKKPTKPPGPVST